MNEPTLTATGATAVGASATTATAHVAATAEQDEWQKLAESLPNRDGHVQTTDPLFNTGDRWLACTLLKPERQAVRDEKGVAIRVPIRFDEESVDTMGTKRAPGYIFRPKGYVIVPADDTPGAKQQADIGFRDLARLLERFGCLPKLGSHKMESVVGAVGKLADKQGEISLYLRDDKKGQRDEETGQLKRYQEQAIRPKGAGAAVGNGTAKQTLSNV